MVNVSPAALAFFQTTDDMASHLHWLTIFVGLIALALLVAAGAMILIAGYAAKLLLTVDGIAKEVKEHTAPLLDKTHALIVDLTPKIQSVSENAEHISTTVRTKMEEVAVTVTHLNETVQQINLRTRMHVAHADGIVGNALNAAEDISNTVQDGIKGPVRQIAGVIAGVRAGVEKLVERSPFFRG
jgi:methyl-accepting chemotaxis protein